MRSLSRVGVAAFIALSPALARAQNASLVVGTVSGDDGRVVAGADVTLLVLGRTARTDSAGRFRFDSLPAGRHLMQVRALGYQPRYLLAQLSGRDTALAEIPLQRTTPTLDTIVIRAQRPLFSNYADFDRRRKMGFGRFITPDQLDRDRTRVLSDLLPSVGVRVGRTRSGSRVAIGTRSGCPMQIYIDGLRMTDPRMPPPNVDDFLVADLAAIEMYAGPAETPQEFVGPGMNCGTLVLWTRMR